MAEFVKVARTTEIEPGQARLVEVKGKRIALFNVDGQFYALDNTCTHHGGPLADGAVLEHEVTCPYHGAKFDIRTGEVLGPPASQAVARFTAFVWRGPTSRWKCRDRRQGRPGEDQAACRRRTAGGSRTSRRQVKAMGGAG